MTEPFEHAPLDRSRPSIRLLRILPDLSATGSIQCEIWHADIYAEYTCLSYVWGSDAVEKEICVNGKVFLCRENLWNFLDIARRKYASTTSAFWIDAICINQGKISERNHQVDQMGKIFSNAIGVIAWLGCDKRTELFCQFGVRLSAKRPGNATAAHALWLLNESTEANNWFAFYSNPYWSRAWITQEIFLATSIRLVARETEIGTAGIRIILSILPIMDVAKSPTADNEISRLGMYMGVMAGVMAKVTNPFSPTLYRRPLGDGLFLNKNRNLVDFLYNFPQRKSQIPRDRIYSLLSIADDGHSVKVDYGISDDEVFATLIKDRGLSCLLCSIPFFAQALDYSFDEMSKQYMYRLPNIDMQMPPAVSNLHRFDEEGQFICGNCWGEVGAHVQNEYVYCGASICGERRGVHWIIRKNAFRESLGVIKLVNDKGSSRLVQIENMRGRLNADHTTGEIFSLVLRLDSLFALATFRSEDWRVLCSAMMPMNKASKIWE